MNTNNGVVEMNEFEQMKRMKHKNAHTNTESQLRKMAGL